jgi:hypothetical protein
MPEIATRADLDRLIGRFAASIFGELAFAAKNLATGEEIRLNDAAALPTSCWRTASTRAFRRSRLVPHNLDSGR